MKWLGAGLVLLLIIFLGVPIGVVVIAAVMITPAVAEQVRRDPCSAYDTTTGTAQPTRGPTAATSSFPMPKWGTPRHQSLRSPAQAIPATVKALYAAAATRYKIPWQLLAGIGMAETRHGRNNTTSSAGAQGLMQFMPATFSAYGVDGDNDGKKQIGNDADSIHSAAHYLVASEVKTGASGVIKALWAYNRSISYRNDVLFYASSYARQAGVVVAADSAEDCLPVDNEIPGFDGACPPSHSPAEHRLRPSSLHGMRCVKAAFPQITSMGGRGGRPIGASDHPRGLAVDFMIPKWSSRSGNSFGWKVARWVAAHAKHLRVKYIIWDVTKWNPAVNTTWRPYRHPLGNLNPALAHRDHLHVSFLDS